MSKDSVFGITIMFQQQFKTKCEYQQKIVHWQVVQTAVLTKTECEGQTASLHWLHTREVFLSFFLGHTWHLFLLAGRVTEVLGRSVSASCCNEYPVSWIASLVDCRSPPFMIRLRISPSTS